MNAHVERARQIADAIDSPDPEKTLYEQFCDEWKGWEAEDPTRTMNEFDREIGRHRGYTGKIVRGVTGAARAPQWASGSNKRDEVTATTLAKADEQTVKRIVRDLPREQREKLIEASHDATMDEIRAERSEHSIEATFGDALGGAQFDPASTWADTLIIRVNRNARELAGLSQREGRRLGSMTVEEAFEYLQEAERLIAEERAAWQEQAREAVSS